MNEWSCMLGTVYVGNVCICVCMYYVCMYVVYVCMYVTCPLSDPLGRNESVNHPMSSRMDSVPMKSIRKKNPYTSFRWLPSPTTTYIHTYVPWSSPAAGHTAGSFRGWRWRRWRPRSSRAHRWCCQRHFPPPWPKPIRNDESHTYIHTYILHILHIL